MSKDIIKNVEAIGPMLATMTADMRESTAKKLLNELDAALADGKIDIMQYAKARSILGKNVARGIEHLAYYQYK